MESINPQVKINTNAEIKDLTLRQLEGKWWPAVAFSLIYFSLLLILDYAPPKITFGFLGDLLFGEPFSLSIVSAVFSGVLTIGVCKYFLGIAKNSVINVADLFDGFHQVGQAIIAGILILIITTAGVVCLFIPGIVLALGFSQTYFIMSENPGIGGIEAMKQSWEMMDGHKEQLFWLWLGFIPWAILGALTFFIGYLWLIPYMYVSFANFYLQISGWDRELQLEDHLVV